MSSFNADGPASISFANLTIVYSSSLWPGRNTLLLCLILGAALSVEAQKTPPQPLRTVPTFTGSFVTNGKNYSYTMAGGKPELGGTTTIPTVIVPLSLSFEASGGPGGHKTVMTPVGDLAKILLSPIFQKFAFATGNTQYGDAMQSAEFGANGPQSGGTHCWANRSLRILFR